MVHAPFRVRWYYMGGWIVFFLTGLFLVAGLVIGATFLSTLEEEVAFDQNAVKADGIVINKSTRSQRSGRRTTTVYEVTYRYRVDGNEITQRADVSKSDWDQAIIGKSIPLEYLKSDPNQSRPTWDGGGFHWGRLTWLGSLSFVLLSLAIGIFIFNWKRASNKLTLLGQGTAFRGIVTKIESRQEGKISNNYLIYVFRDDNGQEVIGEEGPLNRHFAKRWQPGEKITVVVDPEDPNKRIADLFELREIM